MAPRPSHRLAAARMESGPGLTAGSYAHVSSSGPLLPRALPRRESPYDHGIVDHRVPARGWLFTWGWSLVHLLAAGRNPGVVDAWRSEDLSPEEVTLPTKSRRPWRGVCARAERPPGVKFCPGGGQQGRRPGAVEWCVSNSVEPPKRIILLVSSRRPLNSRRAGQGTSPRW